MKKYIINYKVWLVAMLTVVSCQSLEEDPVGLLAPKSIFSGPDEVKIAINGGYSYLNYESFLGRKMSLSILLRGDMVTIGDMGTSARRIEVDQMNMSATNGMVNAFWPSAYQSIGALNYADEGGLALGLDAADINPVLAEGRFLRAYIYFNMVRLFGEIPLIDFAFKNLNEAFTIPQASEGEIYDSIIEDLEFAKIWLPDRQYSRSRPGKGTAAALLAEVQLTLENWQSAYDEAKYVIDNSGSFGYQLEPDYADLFDPSLPASSSEVLFELNMIGNDAPTNPGALGGTNATSDYYAAVTGPAGDERFEFGAGWSVAVPSMAVFNTWNSGDYRRAVSFDTTIVNGGVELHYSNWGDVSGLTPRPHIAKMFRALGQSESASGANGRDSDLDIPLIRYAQVLLIAAEALNELQAGPSAESMGYVNEIRSRARRELDSDASNDNLIPADVPLGLDVDSFRELVLEERRLELAFEGHRWFDIKRRQMGLQAFGAGGLEQWNFDPATDYYFPKYQQDVDMNSNLDQNNGY